MESDLAGLIERARAGEAPAQFALGQTFHRGQGVGRDLRAAIRWYELAARQDHLDAQVQLGIVYISELPEIGEPKQAERACAWLEAAGKRGNTQALYYLGRILLHADGVSQELDRALECYERAAEAGHQGALVDLGSMYLEGTFVPADRERGLALLRRAAEDGNSAAHYGLAIALLEPGEDPAARAEARRLLDFAAAAGHAGAQYHLGMLVSREDRDPEAAMRWFVEAARQGDVHAQFEAAEGYRLGRGTGRDLKTALSLYERAAQQGHAGASFHVGLMLEAGVASRASQPGAARIWYQRAAMAGHAEAAHHLAVLLAKGNGVAANLHLALDLFEYAVSLGCNDAMFGAGVARAQLGELGAAATWALLSRRHQPNGKGQTLLDKVSDHLDAGELAEAERRAESWVREIRAVAWSRLDDSLEALPE